MAETTETLYTVARGTTVLTDLRRDVRGAKGDLAAIESSMRAAKLEPDVQLATVTRTTTLSDPTPYSETITVDDAPAEGVTVQAQAGEQEGSGEETPDASPAKKTTGK